MTLAPRAVVSHAKGEGACRALRGFGVVGSRLGLLSLQRHSAQRMGSSHPRALMFIVSAVVLHHPS